MNKLNMRLYQQAYISNTELLAKNEVKQSYRINMINATKLSY
jgi:hypothetical protein